MARKSETFEIDGMRFRHRQLGAIEGRRILTMLIPIIVPALERLDLKDFKSLNDMPGNKMIAVLAHLLENLTPDLTDTLCNAFVRETEYELESRWLPFGPLFDDELAGKYFTMAKWLGHCMQFHFAAHFLGSKPTSGASTVGPEVK